MVTVTFMTNQSSISMPGGHRRKVDIPLSRELHLSRAMSSLDRLRTFVESFSEPGIWQAMQLTALVGSALLLLRTSRSPRRAVGALAVGFAAAALGALALDPILHLPAFFRGAPGPLFRGVIVSWGALLGLIGGFALASKVEGRPVRAALDELAAPLGLTIVLSRIGCWAAGCDFGKPTQLPWAVHYGPWSPAYGWQRDHGLLAPTATQSLGVHPSQAYEVGAGLLMIAVAWSLRGRWAARPGLTFCAVTFVYASLRFFIELTRGDDSASSFGLRTGAWLSVICVALVARMALSTRSHEEIFDPARVGPCRRAQR